MIRCTHFAFRIFIVNLYITALISDKSEINEERKSHDQQFHSLYKTNLERAQFPQFKLFRLELIDSKFKRSHRFQLEHDAQIIKIPSSNRLFETRKSVESHPSRKVLMSSTIHVVCRDLSNSPVIETVIKRVKSHRSRRIAHSAIRRLCPVLNIRIRVWG